MDGHTELKKGRVAFKLINWSDNISNVLNSKNFLSRGPKHFSYGATVSAKYTFTRVTRGLSCSWRKPAIFTIMKQFFQNDSVDP